MQFCFIGDSFTQGVGDEAELGWWGRIVIRLRKTDPDLTAYNLGVRRNTSADIALRWLAEVQARLPTGAQNRLAFCFGANDCADNGCGGCGERRIAAAETIANSYGILAKAVQIAPTILIGPPPILDDAAADARIADLDPQLRAVAERCGVGYLSVFETLRRAPAWADGAASGDGTHPDAAGYAMMADQLWNWPGFWIWLRAETAR